MAWMKVLAVIVVGLLVAWLINMDVLFSYNDTDNQPMSPAQTAINTCVETAEHSVAHLEVALEFQRLEKVGRQARVMRLCMDDHGYAQSAAWTTFAKQQVKTLVESQQISIDEAFENLRRQHMVMLSAPANTPDFWQTKP